MPGHRRDPRPGAGHPLGTRGQPPSQGLGWACIIRCRGRIRNVLKSEFSYRRCGGRCLDSPPFARPATTGNTLNGGGWSGRAATRLYLPARSMFRLLPWLTGLVLQRGALMAAALASPQHLIAPDTRLSPVAQGKACAWARRGACAQLLRQMLARGRGMGSDRRSQVTVVLQGL